MQDNSREENSPFGWHKLYKTTTTCRYNYLLPPEIFIRQKLTKSSKHLPIRLHLHLMHGHLTTRLIK